MTVSARSEWMEDQKHALIMASGKDFGVIQTPAERSVLFSIGTDNVFYATREVQQSVTGWTRLNLSEGIIKTLPVKDASAKLFHLAQNQQTLSFDLALVIASGSTDYLYLSLNNPNTDEFWETSQKWLDSKWIAVLLMIRRRIKARLQSMGCK